MSKDHPGFKAVGASMASKQHIPLDQAYAELASSTRNASKKAKMKNPNLYKVKG